MNEKCNKVVIFLQFKQKIKSFKNGKLRERKNKKNTIRLIFIFKKNYSDIFNYFVSQASENIGSDLERLHVYADEMFNSELKAKEMYRKAEKLPRIWHNEQFYIHVQVPVHCTIQQYTFLKIFWLITRTREFLFLPRMTRVVALNQEPMQVRHQRLSPNCMVSTMFSTIHTSCQFIPHPFYRIWPRQEKVQSYRIHNSQNTAVLESSHEII